MEDPLPFVEIHNEKTITGKINNILRKKQIKMSRPEVIQQLPKAYSSQGPCVYKLSCNDRYVIIKSKDHVTSVNSIQKGYNQFLRNSPVQRSRDNLYFHFYSYAEKAKDATFAVEVLLESESAYELLKFEHQKLKESLKDKKCLNNNTEPYIPNYNEDTLMYGWIPKSAVMSYKKWLKTHK